PCSTPATTWPSPAARSGCGVTRGRSSRCARRSPCGSRCSAPRSRASPRCTRSPEWSCAPRRRSSCSPSRTMWPALRAWCVRTTYDIETMREIGSCSGIENYSRHIDGRDPGSAPNTLLDFFPEDFLLVIDESHVTVPQIGAMYEGDMSRKRTLVEHGFRLPSAMDNRPLRWEEFLERIGQTVYMS